MRPRTSGTASGCFGRPSATPFPRCTPWPGASMTSATARRLRRRSSSSWPGFVTASTRSRRRPKIPCWWPWPPRRRQYQLPLDAFDELIDGCERDVRGTSYATFDDLVVYCRLVAGSIGRLSLAVFGTTDPRAVELADDLGVALQLTNILRDVLEDRGNGRVYLPAADAVARGLPGRPVG